MLWAKTATDVTAGEGLGARGLQEKAEATNAAAAEDTGATEVHLPVSTF